MAPRRAPPPPGWSRPKKRESFEIAIVCALNVEHNAVEALLDERFDDHSFCFGKAPGDPNTYIMGRIGNHAVVVVHLPGIGKANSASAAAGLHST